MDRNLSPVSYLAQLLAEMVERVQDAEKQRDAERENAEEWYRSYRNKQQEVKDLEEKLAEKEEELKDFKKSIQGYFE